jgi:four helix bundle protein
MLTKGDGEAKRNAMNNEENVVLVKSRKFAIRIYRLHKRLCEQKEFVMAKQTLRAGTSIGANLTEAQYAISKKEFYAKICIALKENAETKYWLDLLLDTELLSPSEYESIVADCNDILKLLVRITKTLKRRNE